MEVGIEKRGFATNLTNNQKELLILKSGVIKMYNSEVEIKKNLKKIRFFSIFKEFSFKSIGNNSIMISAYIPNYFFGTFQFSNQKDCSSWIDVFSERLLINSIRIENKKFERRIKMLNKGIKVYKYGIKKYKSKQIIIWISDCKKYIQWGKEKQNANIKKGILISCIIRLC